MPNPLLNSDLATKGLKWDEAPAFAVPTLPATAFGRREIWFNDYVTPDALERIVLPLRELEAQSPAEPITLYLNSYGGDAYIGLQVCDALQACTCNVDTVCQAYCMSAGFMIFLAGANRTVHENSILLMHCASVCAWGKMPDALNDMAFYQQMEDRLIRWLASRCLVTEPEWRALFDSGKDRYFWPEEAVALGLAHQIKRHRV